MTKAGKRRHEKKLQKRVQRRGLIAQIRAFLEEEEAISVIEIVLIIVVLIGLVIIFKNQLTSLVTSILNKIVSKSNSI